MIRVPQVRVVDEDGSQLGVMPTGRLSDLRRSGAYDLVEVAPMAAPPVTRLLDYGQFKYEQARREKEARRHQRSVEFKEIRLKPEDRQGRLRHQGPPRHPVPGGRRPGQGDCPVPGPRGEPRVPGRDLLLRFAEQVQDHGTVERQPLLEGKSMWMVIASTHKPKVQAASHVDGETASHVDGEAASPAAQLPTPRPASQSRLQSPHRNRRQARPRNRRQASRSTEATPAVVAVAPEATEAAPPAGDR